MARDARGYRTDKPYGPVREREDNGQGRRRDSSGKRLNKPYGRKDQR